MKKAITIILLWVVGGILGGIPLWLVLTIAGSIYAVCYMGLYRRFIGVGAAAAFIWGLGVAAVNLPSFPSLYEGAPAALESVSEMVMSGYEDKPVDYKTEIAKLETGALNREDLLHERLVSLENAQAKGTLTDTEHAALRTELLEDFSSLD